MMIIRHSVSATLPLRRIITASVAGLAVAAVTLAGATFASPAGASEIKMPSSKSRLLRDRDDVTIIIIDKTDRKRSRSSSPALIDEEADLKQPSSRIRRDDDTIYIKRTTGDGHRKGKDSGPKVIIVDQNRDTACSGGGVCVIRP